jgi:hypothetical protein
MADMATETSTATEPGQDARVGDHLNAFGDLCTCAGRAAAAWGGESDG